MLKSELSADCVEIHRIEGYKIPLFSTTYIILPWIDKTLKHYRRDLRRSQDDHSPLFTWFTPTHPTGEVVARDAIIFDRRRRKKNLRHWKWISDFSIKEKYTQVHHCFERKSNNRNCRCADVQGYSTYEIQCKTSSERKLFPLELNKIYLAPLLRTLNTSRWSVAIAVPGVHLRHTSRKNVVVETEEGE